MHSFWRWIVMIACTVVFAVSASAQSNLAVPAGNGVLSQVAIQHVDRTVLGEDVVHYRFDVVVGPGKFDRIRLHRIVREKHPWQPIHTTTGMLLFPGGPNSFEMIFLEPAISKATAWDHSVAIFLAKNKIDVWGMDYGWALIPAKQTNFNFMKDWGVQRDVDHAQIAVSLARSIRGMTGQGSGRLHVLGFSYGTFMAYGIANQETQQPRSLRNIKGIVAADWGMVFPLESPLRASSCAAIPQYQALLDAGQYSDSTGVFLKQVGDLARTTPDDPSPFADGFTNYQFALFAGASGSPPNYWHFVGGLFDNSGIATDLRYTDPWLWVDVLRAVPPYMPVRVSVDTNTVNCYDATTSFDDHLGGISLPILYVGAAGGTGKDGHYTTALTASTDITKFDVQMLADDQQPFDFGHADLFTAKDAETLVWRPILDWLVAHK